MKEEPDRFLNLMGWVFLLFAILLVLWQFLPWIERDPRPCSAQNQSAVRPSSRGPGGGYFLARDAGSISVADIVCAVDEWVEYTRSPAYLSKTAEASHSSTRGLWEDFSGQLFDFLEGITLASLVQCDEIREAAAGTGRPVSQIRSIVG